ncbi:FMN-binding negative transcriptional regulator [Seohaeicola saemankumensis]|uniref:FMN-binding negative transcriptional regulator n=1 Tax=Seohaeicola saemankumensis TaxID=481181 RepID=UPI001E411208|nr:FMN-binding negative transcriptional regulator [Seohaeicola saemankumensis]MCD1627947.1 FMN-binding negative transcriptional regulator [Seohaeicola saemankumensis]
MYLPDHFVEANQSEVAALIADYPLAAIVAQTAQGMIANHIPVMAEGDTMLIGHVALNNDMHRLIPDHADVLAIFKGEDGYVSPNLYPTKPAHHRHVPTWNYQVVHVAGRITFQHDDKTKRAIVGRLTRDHERAMNGEAAWRMADAPRDYMETMLAAIVAFRIEITGIAAKSKLSQNREAVDHAGVVASFKARGLDRMAARMRRRDSDD